MRARRLAALASAHTMNSLSSLASRVQAAPAQAALVLVMAALGTALAFQYLGDYAPCALCILQRLGMTSVALLLVAARLAPTGVPRSGLALLAGAGALGAMAAALYQGYINLVPGMSCSAKLMLAINELPTAEWLPEVFLASGDCVLFNPTVFELAMPYAAAAVDAALVVLAGLIVRQSRRHQAQSF